MVGVFDRIEEKRDAMQSLLLPPPARQALAQAALTYRYGDEHQPVTTADILTKRIHTRAIHNIDTDIKLNRALWVMAETLLENLR